MFNSIIIIIQKYNSDKNIHKNETFLLIISQLQEVKSPNDHKLSLLHYFGRLLREKYPDLLNYADDLTALDAAKRISLQTIASEIGTLRKELRASTQEAEVN